MNTIQLNNNVYLAIKFKFQHRGDYSTTRHLLELESIILADAARDNNLYIEALTFPRWNKSEGMMEFTDVARVFDITSDSSLCIRLLRNPITSDIGTVPCDVDFDVEALDGLTAGDFASPSSKLQSNSLFQAYDKFPLTCFHRVITNNTNVDRGLIWYGDGSVVPEVLSLPRKLATAQMWINWICNPDEEFALIFS